jgi:hypothetical protein
VSLWQEYEKLIYSSEEALRTYHEEVNKDNSVNISEWENNSRVVSYKLPVPLIPSWLLTSIIGERPR